VTTSSADVALPPHRHPTPQRKEKTLKVDQGYWRWHMAMEDDDVIEVYKEQIGG